MAGGKTNGVNGDYSSASSIGKPVAVPDPPEPKKEKTVAPPKATRQGVEQTFKRFGQFVQDGREPRPGQYGGDTMASVREKGSIKQDLKYISMESEFCPVLPPILWFRVMT